MSDCLFCGIAAGSVPATKLHEDDQVVAFADINPQAPVHLLVIPREHINSFGQLLAGHAELWHHMGQVTRELAGKQGLDESGYRVVTNIGDNGGQTVPHLHLHLLGGRALGWPPG